MNFLLPQLRALFMAENANATMHNLLPARGALVRDSKAWADYLTEAIRLYGAGSDVMFAAHGIPRFGQAEIVDFLTKHRDAYKYLHDQTLRLMNAGMTPREIAEVVKLPDVLAKQWYNRGYYGTTSHNSKAIYQRYLGWYDANPANLNPHPPEEEGKRYVVALGGASRVMELARDAAEGGDYRWAATLLNHVVFADGSNEAAKRQLADVYTQLGYQAEAGTWRNIYLTGAQELTEGIAELGGVGMAFDLIRNTPTHMLLDLVAVRLDPEKAKPLKVRIVLTDFGEAHQVEVSNGALIHEAGVDDGDAQAVVTMSRLELLMTLLAGVPVAGRVAEGAIQVEGEVAAYEALAASIAPPNPNFNVVTP